MKFVKISSFVIGFLMFIQWIFFLATGNVPELASQSRAIAFHLAAEFLTAACLIASGIRLSGSRPFSRIPAAFAQGMLGYTAVNSSGYFVQNGAPLFLVMFGGILIIAVLNGILLTGKFRKAFL